VLVTIESERKIFHQHTGLQYEVDLVRMRQRNVMTGFERRLLRQRSSCRASTVLQSAVRIWLARKQVKGLRQGLQRHRQDLQRHGAACRLQRVWRACERNRAKPIVLESDEQEIEAGECVARGLCGRVWSDTGLAVWIADKVYVMYHGTPSLENAALIEQNGFRASRGGLLGPGVYVSRDFKKAEKYGGGGVIFEVLVRVGKVCHIEDHEVPIPVGRMLTAGVVQRMVPAGTLHPQGWSELSPWSDAGYDTAWVQASCPDHVFTGGLGWGQGIKEETCVFEASRVTVQRRFKWDTDRTDVSSIEWLFEEDQDRLSGHDTVTTHGRFVPFSRRNSVMLESHHLVFADKSKGGKGQVLVTIESERKIFHQHTGLQYEVDLVRMRQRNVMTGFERRLLRQQVGTVLEGGHGGGGGGGPGGGGGRGGGGGDGGPNRGPRGSGAGASVCCCVS